MKLDQLHRDRKSSQTDAESGDYIKNEIDSKRDRLNELWMALERKLLKQQPPRRIACAYDTSMTGEDGDIKEERYLGIQRHGGKWRICYAIAWDHHSDENLPWKPVVECDVDARMDATRGIDQLKEEVRMTKTSFIPALNKAISKLEEAVFEEGEE